MKSGLLAGAVLLLIFAGGDVRGQKGGQSDDREQILRLYNELDDAVVRRDREALNRLLAPDYTIVSPRGRLIIRDVFIQNRAAGVGGGSTRFDQLAVRLYGSMAIVTSQATQTPAGPLPPRAQQAPWQQLPSADTGVCNRRDAGTTRTDTWIKLNGRWQLAATHLAPIGFLGARETSASASLCGVSGDDLRWVESPVFPGARLAALYGEPYNGPYALRMQRPDGHIEEPHRHESDETVSVTSGVIHIGVGDQLDRASTRAFRAGAHVVIPAGTPHYSWAEGEVIQDVSWNGSAEPAPERQETPLPRSTLESYVGTYLFADRTSITVTLDGGTQLMAQLSGAPVPFPIFAESETNFFLKSAPPGSSVGINARILFVKDASGAVTGLTLGNRKATRASR